MDFRELYLQLYKHENDYHFFNFFADLFAYNYLATHFFYHALAHFLCFFHCRAIGTYVRLVNFATFLVRFILWTPLFLFRVNCRRLLFLLLHFRLSFLLFAFFRRSFFNGLRLLGLDLLAIRLLLLFRRFLTLRTLVDDVFACVTRTSVNLYRTLNERGRRRLLFGKTILVRVLGKQFMFLLLIP